MLERKKYSKEYKLDEAQSLLSQVTSRLLLRMGYL